MAEFAYDFGKLRIARTMRSGYNSGTPVNKSTHCLFNNSTGGHVLLILSIQGAGLNSENVCAGYTQSPGGSILGKTAPFVSGGMVGPGVHYYLDTATVISPIDVVLGLSTNPYLWQHDFPFCALQPGWGLQIQDGVTAHTLALGFHWTFLDPADLYLSDLLNLS
jgi:hypothetical protein